ncbi:MULTISPECIES: autotransporter outer membrane beta-barrel domain-containing protein, partial [unclassified Roseobacter]
MSPVGRLGVDVGSGAADDVTVQMGGGTITTTAGFDNHGIRVDGGNSATSTAKVAVTGGAIEIDGENSVGLYSVVSGNGNAIAELGGNSSSAASIVTKGENSHGIDALVNNSESTATATALLKEGGKIETKTANSEAMVARTSGKSGEALAHMSGGKITTHGEVIKEGTPQERTGFAHAVSAILDQGAKEDSKANMTALMTGGEIETMRNNSSGVRAYNRGLGNALAQMEETPLISSTITTHENQSHGLQAFAVPEDTFTTAEGRATAAGRAEAVMVDGTIVINGVNSHGMYAQANGVLGTALVKMEGGRITTTHRNAAAIYARIDNQNHKNNADKTNGVKVIMTGGSILTENRHGSSFGSHGIYADTTGSADVTVDMRDGTITTVGRNSHGIYAEFEGAGDDGQAIVKLGTEAWVTASGAGSDGIRAQGRSGFDVYVAGRVTGGADGLGGNANGAAIRTISAADGGGTIHITDTAAVTAGRSGLAIQDWDGNTAVTLEGAVTGDIRLRGGNDSVTIAATASYDFSHALNGGRGDDHLILSGRTMTSMENVIDWEHLTLKDETKLSLDKGATLDMDLSIEAGSVFSASGGGRGTGATTAGKLANVPGGGITITGDVTNSGTLSVQDGVAGDVITIDGNYTGSGRGVFALDAVMGADGANTDRLVITGDASGETMLSIAGLDSVVPTGAPLELNLVTVGGASDDATFTLMNGNYVTSDGEHGMISGAYLYRLAEVEAQDGGHWWALSALSSTGEVHYGPSAPIYDSYGASLLAFNAPSGLRGRGSSQDFRTLAWGGAGAEAAGQDTGVPLWIQMGTEQLTSAAEQSTTGAARDSSLWEMEIGADLVLSESAAGLFVGGLMLSYGTGSTDVSSGFGDGSIETTGLGLGLAATWYDTRGFYVDGQVTVTSYSSDLSSDSLGSLTEGNSGTG